MLGCCAQLFALPSADMPQYLKSALTSGELLFPWASHPSFRYDTESHAITAPAQWCCLCGELCRLKPLLVELRFLSEKDHPIQINHAKLCLMGDNSFEIAINCKTRPPWRL
jgi:hypothetical protein